jgi:hypothetical protein
MDALAPFLAFVIVLAGFDLAALRWGVDSRTQIGDDHRR